MIIDIGLTFPESVMSFDLWMGVTLPCVKYKDKYKYKYLYFALIFKTKNTS